MTEQSTPERDVPQATERDAQPNAGGATPTSEQTPIESLPADVQDLIKNLNSEAASRRHELNELKQQMARLTADQQQAEEQRLTEQQEFKTLAEKRAQTIEQLKPFQAQVEEMRGVLNGFLEKQIEQLPEDRRALVPYRDNPVKALEWLGENMALLTKPAAPPTDAGARSDANAANVKFSDRERELMDVFKLKPEQVAQVKATTPPSRFGLFDKKE